MDHAYQRKQPRNVTNSLKMEKCSNDTKNLIERAIDSYLSPTNIRLKIIEHDFSLK